MPNLQHVLIDSADLAREVFSPGDAQEFILVNDPSGVQHQGLEQLEFSAGEFQFTALKPGSLGVRVQTYITDFDYFSQWDAMVLMD